MHFASGPESWALWPGIREFGSRNFTGPAMPGRQAAIIAQQVRAPATTLIGLKNKQKKQMECAAQVLENATDAIETETYNNITKRLREEPRLLSPCWALLQDDRLLKRKKPEEAVVNSTALFDEKVKKQHQLPVTFKKSQLEQEDARLSPALMKKIVQKNPQAVDHLWTYAHGLTRSHPHPPSLRSLTTSNAVYTRQMVKVNRLRSVAIDDEGVIDYSVFHFLPEDQSHKTHIRHQLTDRDYPIPDHLRVDDTWVIEDTIRKTKSV